MFAYLIEGPLQIETNCDTLVTKMLFFYECVKNGN